MGKRYTAQLGREGSMRDARKKAKCVRKAGVWQAARRALYTG